MDDVGRNSRHLGRCPACDDTLSITSEAGPHEALILCDGALEVPGAWSGAWPGGRLVCRRHAICRPVLPEQPWLRHGRVRGRRQRRRAEHVRGVDTRVTIRLGDGAARLRRGVACHGRPVLASVATKSGTSVTSLPIRQQLAVLRDPKVWKSCRSYSVVFGGFTSLSIWMPRYFVNRYRFPIAQAALLAACFSLPGGVLRAIGGWLSDRYGAHPVTW